MGYGFCRFCVESKQWQLNWASRPHFPRVEGPEVAVAHPEAEELRRAGCYHRLRQRRLFGSGMATVLSRQDVAVGVFVQHPSGQFASDRVLFARFSCWWSLWNAAARWSG